MKTKAAFFNNDSHKNIDYVYASGRQQKVAELTELYPEKVSIDNFEQHVDKLQDLEVIFSTWGMPALSEQQIDRLPALKAVFLWSRSY